MGTLVGINEGDWEGCIDGISVGTAEIVALGDDVMEGTLLGDEVGRLVVDIRTHSSSPSSHLGPYSIGSYVVLSNIDPFSSSLI